MANKGLTGREKYFRRIESLALSTKAVAQLPLVASPPEHHDGVMVALVPDDPESLAVEHEAALPADDLHVTLCLFGKIQDLSSFDQTRILSTTRRVVDAVGQAFSTAVDGVVIMGQNDDGVPATALLVQSDEIVNLYDALSEALGYESNFPTFIPHMTSGYGLPVEDVETLIGEPVNFSNVIVKFGDDVHTIPLPAALTAAPRGTNVIDRVIDSLGRLWDEALHPRDGEGKFIKKNGAVSGKLAVPTADRKSVNMVDANRASVVGFHTFGDEVWVLAEITNEDGSKSQGFARAANVRAVAPVKARLDALYPIDDRGDSFINSSLERKRQLDLLLAHIHAKYGPENDEEGALSLLETLGLWEKDLDYIYSGENDHLGGILKVERELDDDEVDEVNDIIEDARQVKELRDRVRNLREDPDYGFSAEDAHVPPNQRLLSADVPDPVVIEALEGGADPFSIETDNLLGAMMMSTDRFDHHSPFAKTGVSPIFWFTDNTEGTDTEVLMAGTGVVTADRAYFVKQSVIGAEFENTDIVNEVLASLITEQVRETLGDDTRLLRVPRSVFGDNPRWDGESPPESLTLGDMSNTHQPGHVISEHVGYLIPSDWETTDAVSEEVAFRNDIRDLDPAAQVDQTEAFYEDVGTIYGNEIAKMIVWDFVTLNGDRNPGNAILASSPDGSEAAVLLIDHGFAFDDPFFERSADRAFDSFSQDHKFTLAWRNYVLGGLRLNDNVTESTVRQSVEDFADAYSNISIEAILSRLKAMPGVTDEQVERVVQALDGVVDRVAWVRDNTDTVLQYLTGKNEPLM